MSEPGLIAVIGGESTGKTTLVRELARALPAVTVDETLREWVAAQGRVPDSHEQASVMQIHRLRESRAIQQAASSAVKWVVSDGSLLMTAVYSIVYYDDRSLVSDAVTAAASASLLVWCASDPVWQPDPGQRDGVARREQAQDVIGELLDAAPGVRWVSASGSVDQRLRTVLAALR